MIRAAASTQPFDGLPLSMKRINPTHVIFALALGLWIAMSLRAQEQYIVPTCAEPHDSKKFVGGRYRLLVPKGAIVRRGKDIDYSDYNLGYVVQKKTYWLYGIFGPMATSGNVPNDWLAASTGVTRRTWKRGDFGGVDAKGNLSNGNRWRYFGQIGESVEYHDVPAEAAAFFDRIIDGVCYREWHR